MFVQHNYRLLTYSPRWYVNGIWRWASRGGNWVMRAILSWAIKSILWLTDEWKTGTVILSHTQTSYSNQQCPLLPLESRRAGIWGRPVQAGLQHLLADTWAGLGESQAGMTVSTASCISQSGRRLIEGWLRFGWALLQHQWQMLALGANSQAKLQNHLDSARARSGSGSIRVCHSNCWARESGLGVGRPYRDWHLTIPV